MDKEKKKPRNIIPGRRKRKPRFELPITQIHRNRHVSIKPSPPPPYPVIIPADIKRDLHTFHSCANKSIGATKIRKFYRRKTISTKRQRRSIQNLRFFNATMQLYFVRMSLNSLGIVGIFFSHGTGRHGNTWERTYFPSSSFFCRGYMVPRFLLKRLSMSF